jgi:hypothetical protein
MSILPAVAILLVTAALVAQVLIPRIGERRIERRLTESGGEAFVALDAVPATRLLGRGGRRITVRGTRLSVGVSGDGRGLTALDGFHHVDIELREFSTGPFEVTSFALVREGRGPYRMRSEAYTSGAALADYGGGTLGGIAPMVGAVARQAPLGSRSFQVAIEVELASEEGIVSVASGGGTIGGYPAGPVAAAIAGALARRLEISY